jgi:branched-chain amino acid aminotransferase
VSKSGAMDCEPASRPSNAPLGCGRGFCERVVKCQYPPNRGWGPCTVAAFAPQSFLPTFAALHYGQAIFEGMKVFRQADGVPASFRAEAHGRRLAASAERLCMPPLPLPLFLESIEALVRSSLPYVPSGLDESLYLRPLLIGSESQLGVRPSNEYVFFVIAGPVSGYFGERDAIRVWVEESATRAFPGGTGAIKCAGNYATTLQAHGVARAHGCDQVLWLDGATHSMLEELSGMNVFVVYGARSTPRLVTPNLTGTILPGVTRDSLITLARHLGMEVEERPILLAELRAGTLSGEITEAFACGTAAVVAPIESFRAGSGAWLQPLPPENPIARVLRGALTDIQWGRAKDPFRWLNRIADATPHP